MLRATQSAFDAIAQHQSQVRYFEHTEHLLRAARREAGPPKSRAEKVCGTKRHRDEIKGTLPLTKFIRSSWHNDALTVTLADDLIGGVAHHLALAKDFRGLCALACVDQTCARSVAAYLQTVAVDLRKQAHRGDYKTPLYPLGLNLGGMLNCNSDSKSTCRNCYLRGVTVHCNCVRGSMRHRCYLKDWHRTHPHTPLCPNSTSVLGYLSGSCELCFRTHELKFLDGPIPVLICGKCRNEKTVTVRVHISTTAAGSEIAHVGIVKTKGHTGYGRRYARALLRRHEEVTKPSYRARYNALWDKALTDMNGVEHSAIMINRIITTPQLNEYMNAERPLNNCSFWHADPDFKCPTQWIEMRNRGYVEFVLFVNAPKGTDPSLEFDTFLGLKGCDQALHELESDEGWHEDYLNQRKRENQRDRDHRKRFYKLHKTPHAQKANIATHKLMAAHNNRWSPGYHRYYIGWTGIIQAIAPLSLGEAVDPKDRTRSARVKKASVLISSMGWSTPVYKAIVGECLTITELHQFCFGVRAASTALRHSLVPSVVLEDEFNEGCYTRGYALTMEPASVLVRLLDLPTHWWPRLGPLGMGAGPLIRQFAAIVHALLNATIIFKAIDEPTQSGDAQTIVGWLSGCGTGADNTPTGLPHKIKVTWTLDLKQRKMLVWKSLCEEFPDGDCDPVSLTTKRMSPMYEGRLTRIERALNRKGGVRARSAWHALLETPSDLAAVVERERKATQRDPARALPCYSDSEDDE